MFTKKRAFWQIYIIIAATIVVIITSLGVLYHNSIKSKLTREYLDNGRNLLMQSQNTLKHIVETVFDASGQVYADKDFLNLLSGKKELDFINQSAILNTLAQIKTSSEYIESVALYFKKENGVYCTDYAHTTLENYPDGEFIKEYTDKMGSLFLVSQRERKKSQYPNLVSPFRVITLITKVGSSGYDENNILFINLDLDKVYNSVIDVLTMNDTVEMLVVNDEGELILGNTTAQLTNAVITNEILHRIINPGNENTHIYALDKEKVLADCISSKLLNMNIKLIWLTNYETLDYVLKPFRNFCVIISIIFIMLTLLIEIFVVKRKTRNIDELIYKTFNRNQDHGKSGNVFNNLSSYINYMAENYDQTEKKLEKAMYVFRENYLRNLLIDGVQEQDDAFTRLKEYNICFQDGCLCVITVEIVNLYELSKKNLNANIMKYMIEELLQVNLEKSGFTGEKVSVSYEKIALIINFPQEESRESRSSIMNMVKQIEDDIIRYPDINVAVGVSETNGSIGELNKLYRQSIRAVKYRLLRKQNTVVFYNEISDDGISFQLDDEGIEDKLTGYITTGDNEKAKELLARLFDRLKNEWNLTEEVFQSNNLYLMSMFVTISMRLNISLHKEIEEDTGIFEILGRLKSIHDAELFFRNLSSKLCAQAKKNANTLETYYLKGILNYINDNFEKDISMDTLSAHIGISASYIHRLFKDELKTTFIKYLTKKRIAKAGEYLKNGMKIKEISERLGFTDPKYFIQVFKKQTGCTPNEVRKTLSL